MNKIFIVIFWLISILIAIVFTYENKEKIENIKDNKKKIKNPWITNTNSNETFHTANSFELSTEKIIDLKEKVAFITYQRTNNL